MDTKKQKKPLLIIICILSALLVLGLVLGLTVFSKFRMYTIFSNRGSRLYSPAQIRDIKSDAYDKGANDFVDDMKGRLENGTGINTVLREIYTEDFIYTVDGKYYFSPINFDLKMNKLNNANFSKNSNGEITYSENGAVVSHKGIDISRYQGNIDFSKVKHRWRHNRQEHQPRRCLLLHSWQWRKRSRWRGGRHRHHSYRSHCQCRGN